MHIRRGEFAGSAPTPFPFLENAIKAVRALSLRLRARRPRLPSRAASPRLPACPAHPLPPQTCPATPPGAGARGRRLTSSENFASFSASSSPRLPNCSPLPAAGAVGGSGSPKARGEDAHHMAARSQPSECAGKGEGKGQGEAGEKARARRQREWAGGWRGRQRALTLARLRSQPGRARPRLLLLLLLPARRWRLGAACSARRGSRSPRNAHTLNRYIVDIRR